MTGAVSASGLDDPQYVLSFVPIQRLLLEATQHPLTETEIQKAVQGTPVTLDHLLQLELLRKDKDAYRLNYLLSFRNILVAKPSRAFFFRSSGRLKPNMASM